MRRAAGGFTTRDWAILGTGLLLLAILQLGPRDKASTTPVYLSEAVLDLVDLAAVPTEGQAADDYATFAATPNYHGAFAVGSDNAYGWSDNYTSRDLADRAALAWCAANGSDCRVVARIGPSQDHRFGALPLSRSLARELEAFAAYPGFKALAVSDVGAWGSSWNYKTRADARASAVARCESNLVKPVPDGVPVQPCYLLIDP